MGTLVFVCPTTGQEVLTGLEMDAATLLRLRSEHVGCPHCDVPHALSTTRAWVVGHEPITDQSHLEIEKSTLAGRPYQTGGGRIL